MSVSGETLSAVVGDAVGQSTAGLLACLLAVVAGLEKQPGINAAKLIADILAELNEVHREGEMATTAVEALKSVLQQRVLLIQQR